MFPRSRPACTFAHGRRRRSVKTKSKTRRKRGCKPRGRAPRATTLRCRRRAREREREGKSEFAITWSVRKVETSIKIKLSSDGMVFARPLLLDSRDISASELKIILREENVGRCTTITSSAFTAFLTLYVLKLSSCSNISRIRALPSYREMISN